MLSKFRLSNHKLMIEKGRHLNIRKEFRFCKFCPNIIEDEIHFLTKCKMFSTQRGILMAKLEDKVNPVMFRNMNDTQIFIFLMSNTQVAPLVAKYLAQTLEVREFLLNEHKGHI